MITKKAKKSVKGPGNKGVMQQDKKGNEDAVVNMRENRLPM